MTVAALLLFVAAAIAGAANSVAGGGTLLTFPALVYLGSLDPVTANATSAVALWPGTLGAMWGYRRSFERDRLLPVLLVPALVGGGAGAVLLLWTPVEVFAAFVPGLILFGTILFALHGRVAKLLHVSSSLSNRGALWWVGAVLVELCIATYGGYFGAGVGILTLAMLGLLGLRDLGWMNGLKVTLGMAINAVAVAIFAFSDIVVWQFALAMAVGAALGGWAGAGLVRKVGDRAMRAAIVAIGVAVAVLTYLNGH